MNFDKIKEITIDLYKNLIFFMNPDIANKKSPKKRVYPKEFIQNAQNLLDEGMLLDYLELLQHNYDPPRKQKNLWDKAVLAAIHGSDPGLVCDLITKGYEFKPQEVWHLFSSSFQNIYDIQDYFQEHMEKHMPYMLNTVDRHIQSFKYKINFTYATDLDFDQKADQIGGYTSILIRLWNLSQNTPEYTPTFLKIVNNYNNYLDKHYDTLFQREIFGYGSLKREVSKAQVLQRKVLEKYQSLDSHKDKLVNMKSYLKEAPESTEVKAVKEAALSAAKAVTPQTQKKQNNTPEDTGIPPHIQDIINDICKVYKNVANSPNPEIAFESKNVLEKTVPQLLQVYLSFPENFRKTFRNDKKQSPEDLLLIGLSHQKDILSGFEHQALLDKSKQMEVLNVYSHNKKMSLGK